MWINLLLYIMTTKIQFDLEDKYFLNAFCGLPFNKVILNSWGEVSMCCHQLTQLGKLDDNTNVLDIWRSKFAKDVRDQTLQGNLHPVCTSWNSCPYIINQRKIREIQINKKCYYPRHLEICLPDKHCNVGGENPNDDNPACIMCRRNFEVPNQKDITEFLCEKSRCLMPYLSQLSVLGIAEPFWKDATFKIMDQLNWNSDRDHITFTTNTNGICLNDRMAKRFFDRVPYSDLSWSLDAATPETHIKIRRLDAFDLVLKNLKDWINLREEYGGRENHKVCIYNNINLLNVNEMYDMVNLAYDIGVDRMIMLPTYDQAGVVKLGELLMCEKNLSIFKRESEKAMQRAEFLGFDLQYSKSFSEIPPSQQLVQLGFNYV